MNSKNNIPMETTARTRRDGVWDPAEHNLFLECLRRFPSDHRNRWKSISRVIQTRTATQVRTHAQKYFKKKRMDKARQKSELQALYFVDSNSDSSATSISMAANSSSSPTTTSRTAVAVAFPPSGCFPFADELPQQPQSSQHQTASSPTAEFTAREVQFLIESLVDTTFLPHH